MEKNNIFYRIFFYAILIEICIAPNSPLKKKKKSESYESSEEIYSVDLSDEQEITDKKEIVAPIKVKPKLLTDSIIIKKPEIMINKDQQEILNRQNDLRANSVFIPKLRETLNLQGLKRQNVIHNIQNPESKKASVQSFMTSHTIQSMPKRNTINFDFNSSEENDLTVINAENSADEHSPRDKLSKNTPLKRNTTGRSSKKNGNFPNTPEEDLLNITPKEVNEENVENSSLKKTKSYKPSDRMKNIQQTDNNENYILKENDDFIILDHYQIMPEFKNNRLIESAINIFFLITGLYVLFLGIKAFRLLMVILQFYICYYFLLFFLKELDLYDYGSKTQQISIFFGCIILAFVFTIICYFFEKINFLVFSIAVGSMITLTYVQFFVDFTEKSDRLYMLFVYLGSTAVFSTFAFFYQTLAVIYGSVFVGAVIAPINVGVLFNDFKSFETRTKLPLDNLSDFVKYLIIIIFLMIFGLLSQYRIKRKINTIIEELEVEKENQSILADISQITQIN